MLKLSAEALQNAKKYIKENGRKIDKAYFEYYFENGTIENVLSALRDYQNEDGGFAHGIEPDFRLKLSSPMATTVGFQFLKKLNVSAENELVREGIKFFLDTYDHTNLMWNAVPKEINDEPHAPWWHFKETDIDNTIDEQWGNPSAEIIGYLHEYSELVPKALLASLTKLVLGILNSNPDKFEMHEMLCYLRLAESLPQPDKEIVINKMKKSIPNVIASTPEDWDNYGAKPIMFVSNPASPLVEPIKKELELNLDYEIERQDDEGSWSPNWQWGQYEEDWKEAQREWRSFLTVDTLIKLHKFGRIEG